MQGLVTQNGARQQEPFGSAASSSRPDKGVEDGPELEMLRTAERQSKDRWALIRQLSCCKLDPLFAWALHANFQHVNGICQQFEGRPFLECKSFEAVCRPDKHRQRFRRSKLWAETFWCLAGTQHGEPPMPCVQAWQAEIEAQQVAGWWPGPPWPQQQQGG